MKQESLIYTNKDFQKAGLATVDLFPIVTDIKNLMAGGGGGAIEVQQDGLTVEPSVSTLNFSGYVLSGSSGYVTVGQPYKQITMADYADYNLNNKWVAGVWYQVIDTSTSSFCANLAYYRAQAYYDPDLGTARLSTNGFGKVTNSNGVSREGMVGIDLSNASTLGEVSFRDPINGVELYDVLDMSSNTLYCYNESRWKNCYAFIHADITSINIGDFAIVNSEIGKNAGDYDAPPVNIYSIGSSYSARIYDCRIQVGSVIYFAISNQLLYHCNIGYGNNIYLPQSDPTDGWNIGNGNSIFADGQTPAGMSNLTMGNSNTITTIHPGSFDNSNCTFSNNQHYEFSYGLHDCNFGKGYLEYKALLSQSGTDAPTATVIVDEVGGVSYSYDATGGYSFSSSNYPSFPSNTLVYFDMGRNVDGPQNGSFNIWLNGVSVIQLFNTVSDDQLSGTPFTIQIPLP